MTSNIVLIGYRGCGKSTIGKLLAERTGKLYISTDGKITEKAGMSIPAIVEKHGWQYFRDLESSVVEEVSGLENFVIDTGGGVVLRGQNVGHLKKNGRLILLTAALEKIVERIQSDPNRPPLKEGMSFMEEQKKVLEERAPIYKAAADFTVDTSNEPADSCVDRIISYITKN